MVYSPLSILYDMESDNKMKEIEIEDEEDTEERRAEINAEDSIGGYDDMY